MQRVPSQMPASEISRLKSWVEDPASSALLAESRGVRTSCLDFAVDFLAAIQDRGFTVIWALPFFANGDAGSPTIVEILRSLVLQVLSLNSNVTTRGNYPVTMRHIRSAVTTDQWFRLLKQCLSMNPALFMIVDLGLIEAATEESCVDDEHRSFRTQDFVEALTDLAAGHVTGCLKIMITSANFKGATSLDSDEQFGDSKIFTDRGRKFQRLMRQPKYRGIHKVRTKKVSDNLRGAIGTFNAGLS